MPSTESMLAFAVASLLLIVVPGPSVLFVVGRSLALGRRGGLLSALGNGLGGLPLVAAVAFGVGAFVASSVAVFTTVKLAGAAYLVYLGVQAIRHRRDGLVDGETPDLPRESSWRVLRQGLAVGITNPKSIVFFIAALPQFVDRGAGAVPMQMMVLGLIFTLVAFTCDATWALTAGSARTWFASSVEKMAAIRAAGGGMMIGLGGVLAFTGPKH